MRKEIDKYIEHIWLNIYLDPKDDLLFYIDNYLFYHFEHLKLRWVIKGHLDAIINEWFKECGFSKETNNIITDNCNKQEFINSYIKSFFVLLIIEISKFIEWDIPFKKKINQSILITSYERLRRGKPVSVDTISDQIIHFRDACVHNRNQEISKWPEFKRLNINREDIHLNFVCDSKTSSRLFMIWHWTFTFDTMIQLINLILNYYWSKK